MKILLPVDGSECSQNTLVWAARFLNKTQSQVYLLSVVEAMPLSAEVPSLGQEYNTQAAQEYLQLAKTLLNDQGLTVVEAQYIVGEPVQAICTYADDKEIDQIIMGSHGRKGLAGFFIGSISQAVFAKAKQPVLIFNNSKKPSIQASSLDAMSAVQS